MYQCVERARAGVNTAQPEVYPINRRSKHQSQGVFKLINELSICELGSGVIVSAAWVQSYSPLLVPTVSDCLFEILEGEIPVFRLPAIRGIALNLLKGQLEGSIREGWLASGAEIRDIKSVSVKALGLVNRGSKARILGFTISRLSLSKEHRVSKDRKLGAVLHLLTPNHDEGASYLIVNEGHLGEHGRECGVIDDDASLRALVGGKEARLSTHLLLSEALHVREHHRSPAINGVG